MKILVILLLSITYSIPLTGCTSSTAGTAQTDTESSSQTSKYSSVQLSKLSSNAIEQYSSNITAKPTDVDQSVLNARFSDHVTSCTIPVEAQEESIDSPNRVVGDGTPESCSADAFIKAVSLGGVIVFDCGSEAHTIELTEPAKVVNDASPEVIIDGGGLITLSGSGTSRILYMNTCDPEQVWTTAHCQNQDHPQLTVQNLTFINGNARNESEYDGGGAIWVRGGRFKVVNSQFFNNTAQELGPDVGGGAIRVFSQFENKPVYVVNSLFGGADSLANYASNGGALSSIGVSWTIINSFFSHNYVTGNGGNPAQEGTPGGGSGGAIYNDGQTMTLTLCGSEITNNSVIAFGSGIFFVSNDHSGNIVLENSHLHNNTGGSWYAHPGISMHSDTPVDIVNSMLSD
ncbi:MAG: hypothetical protein OCD01_00630 [Fibrobacterales bacterium]